MKEYPVSIHNGQSGLEIRISVPDSEVSVIASQDVCGYREDMCQILLEDTVSVDPAVCVRLNDDGTVAEILVRDDLYESVRPVSTNFVSDWLKKRDGDD